MSTSLMGQYPFCPNCQETKKTAKYILDEEYGGFVLCGECLTVTDSKTEKSKYATEIFPD